MEITEKLKPILFEVEKIPISRILPGYDYNSENEYVIVGKKGDARKILNFVSERYVLQSNNSLFPELISQIQNDHYFKLNKYELIIRYKSDNDVMFNVDIIIKSEGDKLEKDQVFPMIRVSNSYNGVIKLRAKGAQYRLVCENGATAMIDGSEAFVYDFKHSDTSISIRSLVQEINKFLKNFGKVQETNDYLKRKPVYKIDDVFKELIFGTAFPLNALPLAIERAKYEERELGYSSMNLFLAYNGLNYILSHDIEVPTMTEKGIKEYDIKEHIRQTIDKRIMENALSL